MPSGFVEPARLLRYLASIASAGDLTAARNRGAACAREAFGASAVVVSHVDPAGAASRVDAIAVAGAPVREERSERESGLAGRVMKKGGALSYGLGREVPERLAEEAVAVSGRRPGVLVGWPIGGDGSLVVFDPGVADPDRLAAALLPVLEAAVSNLVSVERARLETERLGALLELSREFPGEHPDAVAARAAIVAFRAEPRSYLLAGERGTGKGALARLLHSKSRFADRLFLEIDVSRYPALAIETGLFEDWFGKGALLTQDIFLYLHDALELDSDVLTRLDGALESARAFVILGTMADPGAAPLEGFGGRVVRLPPLRERPGDLPLLAQAALGEALRVFGRGARALTPGALEVLREHPWPGNLTELRSVVGRAARSATSGVLTAGDVRRCLRSSAQARSEEGGVGLPEESVLALLASRRYRNWKEAVRELRRRFLPSAIPILVEKLESPEAIVRLDAVDLLVRHGGEEARRSVLDLLPGEPDRDVVVAGIRALAAAGVKDAAWDFHAFLSRPDAGVRVTALAALSTLGGGAVLGSVKDLAADADPEVSAHALATLHQLGDAAALHDLLAMLRDDAESVRVHAAEALGQVPDGVSALLRLLDSESSPDVLVAAIASLGRLRDPQAVRPLAARLDDPVFKIHCVEALGEIGAPGTAPALFDLVARDPSALVQRSALRALAATGEDGLVGPLGAYLAHPELGATAVEALGLLGGPEAERKLAELVRPDHPLRGEAVKGLVRIGTALSAGPLVAVLGEAPDFLARSAVEALVRIGEPAVPFLVDALGVESKRGLAASALGAIGDPRAVLPLLPYLEGCQEASEAIERIGPAAIPALLSALPMHEDEILGFLVAFGEESIEPVLGLLGRGDVTGLVEKVLVYFGEGSVELTLLAIEGVEDEAVLAPALRILGKIGSLAAMPVLLKHFVSPRRVLREAVVEGLAGTTNPLLVEGLVEAVEGGDEALAACALLSLAPSRAPEAFPAVRAALAQRSAPVRLAALECAASYGGEARRDAIQAALDDPDPLVLARAAELAVADGLLSPDRLADVRAIRAVGALRSLAAGRALLSLLDEDRSRERRKAALEALASWDARLLPLLWPRLESDDPGKAKTADWILGRLSIPAGTVGGILLEYDLGSPARRRWIEELLRANGAEGVEALELHLERTRRDEERSTALVLLHSLAGGPA